MLIQNTNDLLTFINDIGTPPYIALDTEFISEKTYFPQLCLIQIAYGEQSAVIDTLSGLDMEPLIKFLKSPDIIKVLHAANQDLIIFWNDYKLALEPVFDTQVAALVCGFGDQVSYGNLVKAFTGKALDKGAQIVDWSRRPLNDGHIKYAEADVSNLLIIYDRLLKEIEKRGRANWISEEMRELSNPARYGFDPDAQLKKLKMRGLSRRRLATLREMICWREEQARSQNMPRGWVLKDLALRDIAAHPPKNLEQLSRIRSIGGSARGRVGQDLLERIKKSLDIPLAECPPVDEKEKIEQVNENAMVLLRALLTNVCKKHHVAPKLVASKTDLEHLILGKSTRITKGWRGELFGSIANQLLEGSIALALTDGDIEIVRTD